ncbi:hypothetical protein FRB99_002747 [Tulasnella sp. 403]|nr:hypothetical protein FRB99_002747 [Tulasnella sp. 403]
MPRALSIYQASRLGITPGPYPRPLHCLVCHQQINPADPQDRCRVEHEFNGWHAVEDKSTPREIEKLVFFAACGCHLHSVMTTTYTDGTRTYAKETSTAQYPNPGFPPPNLRYCYDGPHVLNQAQANQIYNGITIASCAEAGCWRPGGAKDLRYKPIGDYPYQVATPVLYGQPYAMNRIVEGPPSED